MTNASTPINDVFDPILVSFDQAMLALHLSRQSQMDHERLYQATLARDRFTAVLATLNELSVADAAITQEETWQLWHLETRKSLAIVEEDLLQLQPYC